MVSSNAVPDCVTGGGVTGISGSVGADDNLERRYKKTAHSARLEALLGVSIRPLVMINSWYTAQVIDSCAHELICSRSSYGKRLKLAGTLISIPVEFAKRNSRVGTDNNEHF